MSDTVFTEDLLDTIKQHIPNPRPSKWYTNAISAEAEALSYPDISDGCDHTEAAVWMAQRYGNNFASARARRIITSNGTADYNNWAYPYDPNTWYSLVDIIGEAGNARDADIQRAKKESYPRFVAAVIAALCELNGTPPGNIKTIALTGELPEPQEGPITRTTLNREFTETMKTIVGDSLAETGPSLNYLFTGIGTFPHQNPTDREYVFEPAATYYPDLSAEHANLLTLAQAALETINQTSEHGSDLFTIHIEPDKMTP